MTINKEPQQLLRLPAVCRLTGLSKSSIYSYIAMGTFPQPIKIGLRSTAWISDEVCKWIDARIQFSRNHTYEAKVENECGK
ncbi:AlpA family transcriptional regulator [bacterium]|nr:AlpA family transcriptional regulator [bacterium]